MKRDRLGKVPPVSIVSVFFFDVHLLGLSLHQIRGASKKWEKMGFSFHAELLVTMQCCTHWP